MTTPTAPFDLCLSATNTRDGETGINNGTPFMRVRIDDDFLAKLHRAQEFCQTAGMFVAYELDDDECDWHGTSKLDVDLWSLRIDRHSFWFVASGNDDETVAKTRSFSYAELPEIAAGARAGAPPTQQYNTRMVWFGGALLCDHTNHSLMATVYQRLPELVAKQLEMDMQGRIAGSPAAMKTKDLPSSPRRRLRNV